ncbi:MAG: ELWxxDGT repeat protein [Paraglaciecola sp.]|jgi:ELWxxDGT repeat protein|uniref:T9SS type A sorting domain-containing protein n=1 Tax=Polaribacter sp. TaxID=1920175 RepID=UPI003AD192AD
MKQKLLLAITLIAFLTSNAQVTILKEINDSGTSSSSPANLFVFNNNIYFAADDSSGSNSPGDVDLGKELWVTDGTESGTTFVKDLRAESASSSPSFFFEFNSTMYFSANTGSGNVLFSSDGTEAGTTATGGTFVFNPLEMGGIVYYILSTDANGLYQFDGTTQVKAANSGTEDVQFSGGQFTSLNNKIIGYGKTTTDDPTIGIELYGYDPATDTYTLIKDITGDDGNAGISNFVTIGSEIYFEATGKVWKTDGTTDGTTAVSAAASINSTNNYFVWNSSLYFEGDDGSNDQLWKYNPAADSILNVSNITGSTATGGNNHDPSDYAVLGDYLYYRGETFDNSSGYVFRTNGTTSELLDDTIKDIDEITVLNGKLYFEGDDGTSGNELYTLDPATLSINKVFKDVLVVYPNPTSNYINISSKYLNNDFQITSLLGQIVKKGKISSSKIIVSDLSKGSYILKITKDNKVETKKIIIQ